MKWNALVSNSREGGLLLDVNLSHIKRYFWEVWMKIHCFFCSFRHELRKKTHFYIQLFLRGFNENITILWAKTVYIHATITICGWLILECNSRGRRLLIEVNLTHIKIYFGEVLIKMPHFYCSIGCTRQLDSINLNLDTNKHCFAKWKRANEEKRHIFVFSYLWEVLMKMPRFFEPMLCIFTPQWLYVAGSL